MRGGGGTEGGGGCNQTPPLSLEQMMDVESP